MLKRVVVPRVAFCCDVIFSHALVSTREVQTRSDEHGLGVCVGRNHLFIAIVYRLFSMTTVLCIG